MSLRSVSPLFVKFAVLTCLTMLSLAIATFGSGLADISVLTEPAAGTEGPGPADAFLPTLLFSSLLAAVFGTAIIRSRWHGWKLIIAVFVCFFGLMTIMTHSESVVFLGHSIRGGILLTLVIMGAIFAGLFAFTSVAVMGKLRAPEDSALEPLPGALTCREWVWRIVVVGAVYLIIYNVFGYFIAWKNPAVRQFYGGVDEGNFVEHLASVWRSWPWMFPFQFGRGILWGLFVLPIVRMYMGRRWVAVLLVALLFSVWSMQLLSPNPFMPQAVARVHFVETSTSNVLFGLIVGLLMTPRRSQRAEETRTAVVKEPARRYLA